MNKFSKHSASISKSDRLYFPDILKNIEIDGRIIVLSPLTANWLVLEKHDLPILELLARGESIGFVADFAESMNGLRAFEKLLAQITARKFAFSTGIPQPIKDNSFKGAYFYLTNACNLSCSHCYMYSGKADAGELTIDEWLNAIDSFADAGGTNITFSGGEILAKRGWFEVVKKAHQRGIISTLLTNGTMWDSGNISDVAPYVAEVQISLDGPTDSINEKTRGSGAFEKAIITAKEFSKKGIRTSIAMTATLDTIHLFENEFREFYENEIVGTGINIKISHKLLNGREVNVLTGINKKLYEETAHRLSELIYPKSKQRSFALEHKPNMLHQNCGFGGASVSSTGDLYPCNRIGDVRPIGNVKVDGFERILISLSESEKATDIDSILPCKYCDLRYVCGGGCRIDDYHLVDEDGIQLKFNEATFYKKTIKKNSCPESYKTGLLRQMVEMHDYQFLSDEKS